MNYQEAGGNCIMWSYITVVLQQVRMLPGMGTGRARCLEKMRNSRKVVVDKPNSFGSPRRIWEVSINMYHKGYERAD